MFTCPEGVELPLINNKPRLVNYPRRVPRGNYALPTPHLFLFPNYKGQVFRTSRFMTNFRLFILMKH